jgi:hypothetical protein
MSPIFAKLNLKGRDRVVVVNAPASFEREVGRLEGVSVERDLAPADRIGFVIAFATTQAEVDAMAEAIASKAEGDAVVWFAYPKGTSRRYRCEFNRDTGWAALGRRGFEPVRQVAIDEDWSALRFRRVEFIKAMTRGRTMAISEEGRAKTSGD